MQIWELLTFRRQVNQSAYVPRLSVDHVDALWVTNKYNRQLSGVEAGYELQAGAIDQILILKPWNINRILSRAIDSSKLWSVVLESYDTISSDKQVVDNLITKVSFSSDSHQQIFFVDFHEGNSIVRSKHKFPFWIVNDIWKHFNFINHAQIIEIRIWDRFRLRSDLEQGECASVLSCK